MSLVKSLHTLLFSLSIGFTAFSVSAAPVNVLVVDTRDAYVRVGALKGLFADIDTRVKEIRTRYEQSATPIQNDLEALKTSKMAEDAKRKRKAELLLKLASLQKQASSDQQAVGKANEAALKQFDQALAVVLQEVKKARGASAILQAQEVLYYRSDCTCNVTEEVYQKINTRLPKLALSR